MIGGILQGTAVDLSGRLMAASAADPGSIGGPATIAVVAVLLAAGSIGGYLLRRRSMR